MENMIFLAQKANATIKNIDNDNDSLIIFNELELNHFMNLVREDLLNEIKIFTEGFKQNDA
jgi:hypothetical protein